MTVIIRRDDSGDVLPPFESWPSSARKQAAEEIRAQAEVEHAAYPDDRFYQGMHAAADLLDPAGARR